MGNCTSKTSAAMSSAASAVSTPPPFVSNPDAVHRIVLCGAGFGGLVVSRALDDYLLTLPTATAERVEVVLLDSTPSFTIGAAAQFVFGGVRTREEVTHSYTRLKLKRVRFVRARITSFALATKPGERSTVTYMPIIDAAAATTPTTTAPTEQSLACDQVLLALGIQPRPDLIKGLVTAANAFNVCVMDEVIAMRTAVDALVARARADTGDAAKRVYNIVVSGTYPHKCPLAPFEYAFLLEQTLRRGDNADLAERFTVTCTSSASKAAPPPNPEPMTRLMKERNIVWLPAHMPVNVVAAADDDAATGSITFARTEPMSTTIDASQPEATLPYDLHCYMAPMRGPPVLASTSLANKLGFVATDFRTLRTTAPGVYACGDCAHLMVPFDKPGPKPHPKSGVFAERQAAYVASAMTATLTAAVAAAEAPAPATWNASDDGGIAREPFSYTGSCSCEMGGDEAFRVDIDLGGALPKPSPALFVVSAVSRQVWEEKRDWLASTAAKFFE